MWIFLLIKTQIFKKICLTFFSSPSWIYGGHFEFSPLHTNGAYGSLNYVISQGTICKKTTTGDIKFHNKLTICNLEIYITQYGGHFGSKMQNGCQRKELYLIFYHLCIFIGIVNFILMSQFMIMMTANLLKLKVTSSCCQPFLKFKMAATNLVKST